MNFTISICQKAIIENQLDIDWLDAALLDFIHKFSLSPKMQKIVLDDKTYFYFSYKYIIDENPLLPFNNKDSIRRRLKNLELKGFITSHPDNQKMGKAFYTFEHKTSLIYYNDTSYSGVRPSDSTVRPPRTLEYDNQSIINNSIKSKKEKKEGEASPPPFANSLEENIYKSIIELTALDENRAKGKVKYIRIFLQDHLEKNELEDIFSRLKNYIAYLIATGNYVTGDPRTLILGLLRTDWHKKLKSLSGDKLAELPVLKNIETIDPTQNAYWELVKRAKNK